MKILIQFAITCFIALELMFPAMAAGTKSAKPNIILVLVDDMGWATLGCYGGFVETPNLDKLASHGLRFTQFYNAARCCPSRASLMTGLHPHETGIGHMTFKRTGKSPSVISERMKIPFNYRGWLGEHIPTLPEMLRKAGYGTYMTGKWHIGNSDQKTWPTQRGFDHFYGFLEGTSDYFNPKDLHMDNKPIQSEGKNYYTTDAFTNQAIQFLSTHRSNRGDNPFFLYLAYNAPHFPLQAMPEDYKKYRGRFKQGWDSIRQEIILRQKQIGIIPKNTDLSPRPGASNKLGNQDQAVPAWESLTPEQRDQMDGIMATYAGMVDRVDQNIGKLTQWLEKNGQLENTIIFFLSDNGAEAETTALGDFNFENLGQYGKGGNKYGRAWATVSNTPFREYKHFTHQGGIQTPLIVHWPTGMNIKVQNSITAHHGFLPDIVETCLDVSGSNRPETNQGKVLPKTDGKSFKQLLAGGGNPIHTTPICIEHEGNRMVRDGKWKLVAFHDSPWELYDVETDVTESVNLIDKQPDIVSNLKAFYAEWAKRAGVIPWSEAKDYSVYESKKK